MNPQTSVGTTQDGCQGEPLHTQNGGYFYQVSYGCEVTKRPSLRRSACCFTLGVKTGACGAGAIKVVDGWLRGLGARVVEVNMMGFVV